MTSFPVTLMYNKNYFIYSVLCKFLKNVTLQLLSAHSLTVAHTLKNSSMEQKYMCKALIYR